MKIKEIEFMLNNPYLRYTFVFGLVGMLTGGAIGTVYGVIKKERSK